MKKTLLALALMILVAPAFAATITVSTLPVWTPSTGNYVWYSYLYADGVGAGGNGQVAVVPTTPIGVDNSVNPMGPGGALMSTTTNDDEVELCMDFAGVPLNQNFLDNLNLSYSFYKGENGTTPGYNSAAAPALCLHITDPGYNGPGRNAGWLLCEPCNNGWTYEQGVNEWHTLAITNTLGNFWHGSIYGMLSQSGSPPWYNMTTMLQEFWNHGAIAPVIDSLVFNLGDYNAWNKDYIDNVHLSFLGNVYDFEPAGEGSTLPEPATVALMGLGLAGLLIRRK